MRAPSGLLFALSLALAAALLAACAGREGAAVPPRPASGKPPADPPREGQEEKPWRRKSEAGELALIREHLRASPQVRRSPYWQEYHPLRRRWAVRLSGELLFPRRTEALDLTTGGSPDWPDLFDEGRGVGLEAAYQLVPSLEPFIGVQYTRYAAERRTLRQGPAALLQESEGLQTIPFYVGLRWRFPLSLPVGAWWRGARAGDEEGFVLFVRVAAGGAWSFGTHLEFTDLASRARSRTRFLERGFVGFTEGAVGIEYRTRSGYALTLAAGVQSYWGLDVDRRSALGRPDLNRLDQFFLPRVTATVYF